MLYVYLDDKGFFVGFSQYEAYTAAHQAWSSVREFSSVEECLVFLQHEAARRHSRSPQKVIIGEFVYWINMIPLILCFSTAKARFAFVNTGISTGEVEVCLNNHFEGTYKNSYTVSPKKPLTAKVLKLIGHIPIYSFSARKIFYLDSSGEVYEQLNDHQFSPVPPAARPKLSAP